MIHGCLLISMSLFITTKKPPEGGFLNRYYSSTVTVFFGFLNP